MASWVMIIFTYVIIAVGVYNLVASDSPVLKIQEL